MYVELPTCMYVEFDNTGILININYIVNMFKDVFF
jgi:hypothetical protein